MDRLTGYSGNDASDAASEFGATFRRNSKPDAVPGGTSRTDTSLTGSSAAYALSQPRKSLRPVLPVAAPKPGKRVAPAEATALSYDQALRIHGAIHGARRIAPNAGPKIPHQASQERGDQGAAKSTVADAVANGRKAAPERKPQPKAPAMEWKSSQAQPAATRSGTKTAPANSSAPIKQKASPLQAGGATRPGAQPRVAEKSTVSIPGAAPAVSASRASAGVGKRRVPAQGPPVSRSGSEAKPQAKSRGKVHSPRARFDESTALPSNPKSASMQEPARRMSRGKMDFVQSSLEVMAAETRQNGLELLSDLSQLDQRRTIVSVRLTEDELACLRDRAEESGISVSAYMRSCVVDADRLRAQVKRALAEMRSLQSSGEPGAMTALTASSRRLDRTGASGANGWFKLVVRPLAILFRPLFPARRSA